LLGDVSVYLKFCSVKQHFKKLRLQQISASGISAVLVSIKGQFSLTGFPPPPTFQQGKDVAQAQIPKMVPKREFANKAGRLSKKSRTQFLSNLHSKSTTLCGLHVLAE